MKKAYFGNVTNAVPPVAIRRRGRGVSDIVGEAHGLIGVRSHDSPSSGLGALAITLWSCGDPSHTGLLDLILARIAAQNTVSFIELCHFRGLI